MLRMTRGVVCLAIMLAALASVGTAGSAHGDDPTLITTGRIGFGLTDGEYVIWQEFDPDWHVSPTLYGALLDDRAPFVIGHPQSESGYYERVRIDDGWVVWVESDSPTEPVRWSLHAMHLASGEAIVVTDLAYGVGQVVLSDSVVVWSEASGEYTGPDTIRGMHLATGAMLDIASDAAYIATLAMSGSTLAWISQDGWELHHLQVRDIAAMSPTQTVTTVGPGVNGIALLDLEGDRLFWHEWYSTYADPASSHVRIMTQRAGDSAPVMLVSGDDVGFGDAVGEQVFVQDGFRVLTINATTGETVVLGHGSDIHSDGRYAFWHTSGMFGVAESPQLVGADVQTGSVHAFDFDGVARHVADGVIVWTQGVGAERTLHAAHAADILPVDAQPQGPVPHQRPSWGEPLAGGTWNAASTVATIPGAFGIGDVDLPWIVWSQNATPDTPDT